MKQKTFEENAIIKVKTVPNALVICQMILVYALSSIMLLITQQDTQKKWELVKGHGKIIF